MTDKMPDEFYVQNKNARYLGNSPIWWAKDGKGYTAYILGAHRFSRKEAEELIAEDPSKYEMFKCADIDARLHLIFDNQDKQRLGTDAGCGWPGGYAPRPHQEADQAGALYTGKTFSIQDIEEAHTIATAWAGNPYPPDRRLLAAVKLVSDAALTPPPDETEKRVENLLEEARQTVKPHVKRMREGEKIGQDLMGFRMSDSAPPDERIEAGKDPYDELMESFSAMDLGCYTMEFSETPGRGTLKFPSDMDPTDYLLIHKQEDGDICLMISNKETMAEIEFCTPMIGGGRNAALWRVLAKFFEEAAAHSRRQDDGGENA